MSENSENCKDTEPADITSRRPLRELQLQAVGPVGGSDAVAPKLSESEDDFVQRRSRWAADVEFRLTLFEEEVKVVSDSHKGKVSNGIGGKDPWLLDELLPKVQAVEAVEASAVQDDGESTGDWPEAAEAAEAEAGRISEDEWPTPPESPLLSKLEKHHDSAADGEHGEHHELSHHSIFSFAKSDSSDAGASQASPNPSAVVIQAIPARCTRSEESPDHFDVDTIDTCVDTTFDSEAQSLLQMCSQLKRPVETVQHREDQNVSPLWSPESTHCVTTVTSTSPSSPSYPSRSSRLRSRTLEPLPSWNFDTLRGYAHRFQRLQGVPLSSPRRDLRRAEPPSSVARRGAAWLAQRRQRHAVRREEQRRREVTECTFQPLTKTTRTTSTTARTSSKVTPSSSVCRSVASPRGAYDRQMQWRQKLDQKVDQQRQRRKELEHLEHLEHLEQQKLHQKLSRNPPSNSAAPATASTASVPLRSPREVDEAFERFHQRSRQWQQACALRVMKARHEHQHHECRGYTKDVAKAKRGKRASRDGSQPCRARSEEPKCRDTPRSKTERNEVHRHLQAIRRALFDSKQWQDGTSPRWQKALQVEVARAEGAGAAPVSGSNSGK